MLYLSTLFSPNLVTKILTPFLCIVGKVCLISEEYTPDYPEFNQWMTDKSMVIFIVIIQKLSSKWLFVNNGFLV